MEKEICDNCSGTGCSLCNGTGEVWGDEDDLRDNEAEAEFELNRDI